MNAQLQNAIVSGLERISTGVLEPSFGQRPRPVSPALSTRFCTPREIELIDRVRSGDTSAFYELIQPYERVVFVAAVSVVNNDQDAEDCAQETFLKALKHIHGFRGHCKFSTWLVQIAINEARMKLRKRGRFDSLDETLAEGEAPALELVDPRPLQLDHIENDELRHILQLGIRDLPQKYREVFVLRDVNQLSITETAAALNITEASVKTRLLRARLKMRDVLLAHGYGQ
jgi:RNA polymerase sigma-70 factor, ECF subfamily